jgi:hypothetical protein
MLWSVPPARLILPVPPASLGFSTSVFPVQLGSITIPCDAALASLIVNLIDTIVLTPTFNALSTIRGRDETAPFDYREA